MFAASVILLSIMVSLRSRMVSMSADVEVFADCVGAGDEDVTMLGSEGPPGREVSEAVTVCDVEALEIVRIGVNELVFRDVS